MTEKTVAQIIMVLAMVNVILRTSSRCVITMEGTVVNLRKSMMGFVMLETWIACAISMKNGRMIAFVITKTSLEPFPPYLYFYIYYVHTAN